MKAPLMPNDRLLLYFDILGFKKLVLREPLERMVERFDQIYSALGTTAVHHETRQAEDLSVADVAERQDAIATSGRQGKRAAFETATHMTLLIMSDSIIVYSKPLSRSDLAFQERLSAMLRIGRTLLDKLLEYSLPCRGALSFGEFHADPSDGIYVGSALVEAYEYAESQDWIGAVVAPSLHHDVDAMQRTSTMVEWPKARSTAVPQWDYRLWDVPLKRLSDDCTNLLCGTTRRLLRRTPIAMHCKHEWRGVQRLYVLNWATSPHASRFAQSQLVVTGLCASQDVARKYKNTLSFLNQVARARLAA
jgi:hypothetical protein